MKSGFKDPSAIKKQDPKDQPKDGKNSPWDFRCPDYDRRSGCFVNAGTHYGEAIKQPVGRMGNPKVSVDALPKGRVNTMVIDEKG